jgi:hypothetical protein
MFPWILVLFTGLHGLMFQKMWYWRHSPAVNTPLEIDALLNVLSGVISCEAIMLSGVPILGSQFNCKLRPDVSWGVREKKAVLPKQKLHIMYASKECARIHLALAPRTQRPVVLKLHVKGESSSPSWDDRSDEPSGRPGRCNLHTSLFFYFPSNYGYEEWCLLGCYAVWLL